MQREMRIEPNEEENPRGLSDEAFEALLDAETLDNVYGVAYKFARNPDDAQDIAQEALTRAWRARENFEHRSEFSTWLHTITSNSARTFLEKRKRRQGKEELAGDEEPVSIVAYSTNTNDPEEEVVSQIMREKLNNHLTEAMDRTKLKTATRVAVLLAAIGVAHKVIAQETGIKSEGAVKVRIHRAHNKLRETLESERHHLTG